jgi:fructose/tagatose bisphosphate aldolase
MGRRPLDMDNLVLDLVMEPDKEKKKKLFKKILNLAYKKGIYPASIHQFYRARGRAEFSGFTVPAINLRTLTYDLARAVFRVAKRRNSLSFIFEIAKSEIGYTDQSPVEYAGVVLASAIKEDFKGPVFIQGDHFQVNLKKFRENPEAELDGLKTLIEEAIEACFYNIDIDSSTLVDLSQPEVKKQQFLNYDTCAKLTQFIRKIQPRGIEISVGGEIGEVGGKNSTPEELRAFMEGFKERLEKAKEGISKISVQTGTTHGGVVLPDGSIAKVNIDFETLRTLSEIARKEFGLAGCVQHGASTLPAEAFGKFPETETAEIHLATEFQNMVYESKHFPSELRQKIYAWLKVNAIDEKKETDTEEQFIYKTRKKALGPFKKEIMGLPNQIREAIAKEVEEKFDFLFQQLKVINNKELVLKYTPFKRVIIRKRKETKETVVDTEGAD